MIEQKLLSEVQQVFSEQGRLINLPEDKKIVFVGDTHGDTDATKKLFERFISEEYVIVLLGDYVDRGPDSVGNLNLILKTKLANPESVFPLMGNHEGWSVTSFAPAEFWEGMDRRESKRIAEVLSFLPFAAWHVKGVLGVHGALPDVDSVNEIADVQLGSSDWRRMTWGDWAEAPGSVIDPGTFGRPTYGRTAFETISERLGVKALVRSHQPHAPTYIYSDRCLTIFTSHAYGDSVRRVALLDPEKEIGTARDMELVEI